MNTMKDHFKFAGPLASIPLVCVLLIGAMPNAAEAGVCGRLGAKANCVNSRDVKDNSLTSIDILDNSLTSTDIQDNSLTATDVQDDSLTATDQKDEAGADFAGGGQFFGLTGGNDIIRSVTITAPTAGRVIANASGSSHFSDNATFESMSCSITTGVVIDTPNISASEATAASGITDMPFGVTRGFIVAAGSTTFNLVCNGSNTVFIHNSSLTAIFVPTAY
jgi:hypothetical protein